MSVYSSRNQKTSSDRVYGIIDKEEISDLCYNFDSKLKFEVKQSCKWLLLRTTTCPKTAYQLTENAKFFLFFSHLKEIKIYVVFIRFYTVCSVLKVEILTD